MPLRWIGTVLLWIAVIPSISEGDTFTWKWWLSIVTAVAVTISAIGLSQHPTKS